jgi:hypothetical protein
MPRVHTVKANKNYPDIGVKKGETYYWWKKRTSPKGGGYKVRSKTRPTQSQLTTSPFWSAVYAIQEQADKGQPADLDDLEGAIEDLKGELESLRDETQEKFDNMPEGLQQGDTGQMLEERVSAIEDAVSQLEDIDCSFDEDSVEFTKEKGQTKAEAKEEAIAAAKDEKLQEAWTEVTDALSNISCS